MDSLAAYHDEVGAHHGDDDEREDEHVQGVEAAESQMGDVPAHPQEDQANSPMAGKLPAISLPTVVAQ